MTTERHVLVVLANPDDETFGLAGQRPPVHCTTTPQVRMRIWTWRTCGSG